MNNPVVTSPQESFHSALHIDVHKPLKMANGTTRSLDCGDGHQAKWAKSRVDMRTAMISIAVGIDFTKGSASSSEFQRLKYLAANGIASYWSQRITLDSTSYKVALSVINRPSNALRFKLDVSDDEDYTRSHNLGLPFGSGTFVYNKGYFKSLCVNSKKTRSEAIRMSELDFCKVAAHEFGHSVLMYAGGKDLSWGHKGSTTVFTQELKKNTPGYPSGKIDLMQYYDGSKSQRTFYDRMRDTVAVEQDIKRLIWASEITWVS